MSASPTKEAEMPTEKEEGVATAAPTKKEPGHSWKEKETHVLPHNRLSIVFLGMSWGWRLFMNH